MSVLLDLLGGEPPHNNIVFHDVPVIPTNHQIEDGSELVPASVIPNTTICSVCQHNEYRSEEATVATVATEAVAEVDTSMTPRRATVTTATPATTAWRRLLNCGHEFHRPCIDQWFSQSVLCPICRNDIRD